MSHPIYLTKSDLKTARSCSTKLYYKKLGYPTVDRVDSYTRILSDGNFIISKIAHLLYPEGIYISANFSSQENINHAVQETINYLQQENVVLFEPVFYSQHKLARADILVKQGDRLEIIEIKSKAFDSSAHEDLIKYRNLSLFRNKRTGKVGGEWRHIIEDVSYQVGILQEMLAEHLPNLEVVISPYLIVPDKAKTTSIDNLASYFQIQRLSTHRNSLSKFNGIKVNFTGDIEQIHQDQFLTKVSIAAEVDELIEPTIASAQKYINYLIERSTQIFAPISKSCKGCEYRASDRDSRDGFKECWGDLADEEFHVLDLYQMGRIGGNDTPLVNELIQQKKVSMFDVPLDELNDYTYSYRQLIQIEYTQKNKEWISEHLPKIMQEIEYPIHFIDFETSRMAIPYRAGRQPYEQVAFQWSCHTISEPDAPPVQTEWLDLDNNFPNFQFAESLMECLGDRGTILTWATHENSVLRDIYYQMQAYDYQNPELQTWLANTAKLNHKGGHKGKSTLVDMNALTLKYYFHPLMKGRTSLKCVLPAVWKTNSYLHEIPWFKEYFRDVDGEILSPYDVLSELQIGDRTYVVNEGAGAMLAYQDLMYGESRELCLHNPEMRSQWQELLYQYCRLDTMAMVIIWTHWHNLCSNANSH
ncbi:DUF2779 domain-containing protein [Pseudanabaena sp. FACHB-1998]|uniref:DUF2779 domain-containing protein n=1 Tax=Pseudanabaena sp. FACHB-1998 TaxID=2692858 RepID=UPI00168052E7|nr:DUF2779 domain-containing protein [Pseudanabaena sp. FACHB-1998]MBD2175378.1 DUF2779 domain-containing protein [Pseudanabaena sp. FACHB-1998]